MNDERLGDQDDLLQPAKPRDPMTVIVFWPNELARLKPYRPGPSGQLGGYARMVNWLVAQTAGGVMSVALDAVMLERLVRYIRRYGGGGPNGALRAACTQPMRRAGVDPLPEWAAPITPPEK